MKILIVKMSSLGDIIHAFPVIDTICRNLPQAQIDWVVEKPFAELVEAHPNIGKVMTVQTKKWRSRLLKKEDWREMSMFAEELRSSYYDLVLDLQGNTKSAVVTAAAKAARKVGFARKTVSEWPNIFATHQRFDPPRESNVRDENLFLVQSALGPKTIPENTLPKSNGVILNLTSAQQDLLQSALKTFNNVGGVKAIICPGSNWGNKQLSKETLQNFLHLFSNVEKVHFFLAWGTKEEKAVVEEIALSLQGKSSVMERYPLPVLQNLMHAADLVIAMDSLPLHLAGTTSTLTYSIFGASSANKYKPIGLTQHAYQGECPYGRRFERRCPILRTCSTGACIKQLEAETLFNHFYPWWKKTMMHEIPQSFEDHNTKGKISCCYGMIKVKAQ